MDYLNYIILLFIFISFFLFAMFHVKRFKKTIIGIILSAVLFIISAVLFSDYATCMINPNISTEGIQITTIMRLFMLDDHFTSENVAIGFITSSFLIFLSTVFLIYYIIKYVRNNK